MFTKAANAQPCIRVRCEPLVRGKPMNPKPFRPRCICLIGIFDPTSGGQAAVNESIRRQVVLAGATACVIDLSPARGPATLSRRLSRIPKVSIGVIRLLSLVINRKIASTYIGLSGGYGQMYALVFVGIARLAAIQLYIHHDSFAYLDRALSLIHISEP